MHGSRATDNGAEAAPPVLVPAGGGEGNERTSCVRGRHATNACKMALAKHTLVELVRPRGRSGSSVGAALPRSRCGDAVCSKAPPDGSHETHATARDERSKTRQRKRDECICWSIFAHMCNRVHTEHRFECCRGRTGVVCTSDRRCRQWCDSRRYSCSCRRQSWRCGALVGRRRCARTCCRESSRRLGGRWRAVGHLCPG